MSEDKPTTHERRARNSRAFDQVIEMYVDLKSTGGGSTQPKGVTKGSRVVAPSTCDFICDVDLTVNRALPATSDRATFRALYAAFMLTEPDAKPEVLARIKDRVGQLFISRGVYPVHKYFKGKSV